MSYYIGLTYGYLTRLKNIAKDNKHASLFCCSFSGEETIFDLGKFYQSSLIFLSEKIMVRLTHKYETRLKSLSMDETRSYFATTPRFYRVYNQSSR